MDPEKTPAPALYDEPEKQFDFKPHMRKLWKVKWKLMLTNIIIAGLAVAFLLFFSKPYYEVDLVLIPDINDPTSMEGMGSALKSFLPGGDTPPLQLYQTLLAGEDVLTPVLLAKYQTAKFEQPVTLVEYFNAESAEIEPEFAEKAERVQFLAAFNELIKSVMKINYEMKEGVLTVKIKTSESQLSADIANNVFASLDDYLRNRRKSTAKDRRQYLEKRVTEVKDTLTIFENQFRDFREKNRIVEQSPMLLLEQGRYARQVELRQEVYIEIIKQLEIAKIDEIKNTPVANRRETVGDPVFPSGPRKKTALAIIMVFSIAITFGFVLLKDPVKKFFKDLKE